MIDLPVTGDASQSFNIVLDNRVYIIAIDWNSRFSYWTICIQTSEAVDLVRGTKLVPNFPLFTGHTNPLLPAGQMVVDASEPLGRDSFTNGDARLVYATEAEVNAIL